MGALRPTILLGADIGRRHLSSVRYRRAALEPAEVVSRSGIPMTAAFRTCVEAVLETRDLVEAVVVVDAIANALELDLADLLAWCRCRGDLRGLGRVREALGWADPDSASSWETRLRMFYRREAALPQPLVNQPVFDLGERLLGVPDLFDPEAGLATEFDGQDHRERRQHRADNLREEELEGANLVVCRVDSLDFRQARSLADRLRRRHAQGLARDVRRDRWTLEQPEWWRRRQRALAAKRARSG